MEYVNLEIALWARERDVYTVAVRWQPPGSLIDEIAELGVATFDWQTLREYNLDAVKHGQLLTDSLFEDQRVRAAFAAARVASEVQKAGLRVRLLVHRTTPELHDLRWETLRDPAQKERILLTNEQILFSRYLSSLNARTIPIRRKQGRPRALVAVANTIDPADHNRKMFGKDLPPVQVEQEVARARSGFGDSFDVDVLASDPAHPGRVTLNTIIAKLRESYDVFYLVCHGALRPANLATLEQRRDPILLLEREGGGENKARGQELVDSIADLREQPRLVVLASCQSAGDSGVPEVGEEGALAALGPRIVEAGVPAVIAMQGNVEMKTEATFMPYFFERLCEHGIVDLAMAEARSRIRSEFEFWVPVLFSRLREGRIWYEPRFAGATADDTQRWETIKSSIERNQCLPILGSGLTERLFGSASDMARNWAGKEQFPLAERYAEELPQVAQYVLVTQDPGHLRKRLTDYWQEMLNGCISPAPPNSEVSELVKLVGAQRRKNDPNEPHRLLAALGLPIYVTANQDTWMEDAIRDTGAVPTVEYFRWNPKLRSLPRRYEPKKRPAGAKTPLVYHLFGTIEEPDSLVLTEDDYFEFLISIAKNLGRLPSEVDTAWSTHVLLFLGFSLNDWHFRLMFHSIMDADRRGQRFQSKARAVAVQISPEEGTQQPRRAQHYFQQYFSQAVTDMYIGRGDDFVKDLWDHSGRSGA